MTFIHRDMLRRVGGYALAVLTGALLVLLGSALRPSPGPATHSVRVLAGGTATALAVTVHTSAGEIPGVAVGESVEYADVRAVVFTLAADPEGASCRIEVDGVRAVEHSGAGGLLSCVWLAS